MVVSRAAQILRIFEAILGIREHFRANTKGAVIGISLKLLTGKILNNKMVGGSNLEGGSWNNGGVIVLFPLVLVVLIAKS